MYVRMYVRTFACMDVGMYVCAHVCVILCMQCMHGCMYVCMYERMYACMHVCMYGCRMEIWMERWMVGVVRTRAGAHVRLLCFAVNLLPRVCLLEPSLRVSSLSSCLAELKFRAEGLRRSLTSVSAAQAAILIETR